MTTLIAILVLFSASLLAWILFLRRWLKAHGYAQAFFAWIEPIEIALYSKSETILWARLQQLGGFVMLVLPEIGAVDATPFLPFVPDNHKWWVAATPGVALAVNGMICEHQRRHCTKPLEVVALPAQVPPDVAAAVEKAEAAKQTAVEIVQQAKEEQKL